MVAQLADCFTRFAGWRFHFNRNRVKSKRLNSYYFVTILEKSQRLKAASQENFQPGPLTKYGKISNNNIFFCHQNKKTVTYSFQDFKTSWE